MKNLLMALACIVLLALLSGLYKGYMQSADICGQNGGVYVRTSFGHACVAQLHTG